MRYQNLIHWSERCGPEGADVCTFSVGLQLFSDGSQAQRQ